MHYVNEDPHMYRKTYVCVRATPYMCLEYTLYMTVCAYMRVQLHMCVCKCVNSQSMCFARQ